MSKVKLRKLIIAHQIFLWKVTHSHLTEYKLSPCVENLVIYLNGHKNSPVRLQFREEDNLLLKEDHEQEKWCVGYPDTGVIWLFKQRKDRKPQTDNMSINLNRPAVIAKFIAYLLENEWKPKESKSPLVITDALKFLEVIELPKGIG